MNLSSCEFCRYDSRDADDHPCFECTRNMVDATVDYFTPLPNIRDIDLLDRFAGRAMQALVSGSVSSGVEVIPPEKVSVDAYELAKAMLVEHNKLIDSKVEE